MKVILSDTNLCPSFCKHFKPVKTESLVEYCDLPDGKWTLTIKDNELQECPLGNWDLRVAKGAIPTAE